MPLAISTNFFKTHFNVEQRKKINLKDKNKIYLKMLCGHGPRPIQIACVQKTACLSFQLKLSTTCRTRSCVLSFLLNHTKSDALCLKSCCSRIYLFKL